MIEDVSKTKRQEEAILRWRNNKGLGTLNLIMGFGKTRVAARVQELCNTDSVLCLAPSDIACKNLVENGLKNVYSFTRFLNNDMLWKPEYRLVIIDEIHRVFDGSKATVLDVAKGKFKLGLTGSKMSTSQEQYLASKGFPIVDRVTESEAILQGWLAPFIEYNCPIQIDDNTKEGFARFTKIISHIQQNVRGVAARVNSFAGVKIFKDDFDMLYSASTGKTVKDDKTYQDIWFNGSTLRAIIADAVGLELDKDAEYRSSEANRLYEYWNPKTFKETCISFRNAIQARTDIINYNLAKINAVMALCKGLPNNKIIIFNQSTDMVDHLANCIPHSTAYHSQMESRVLKDENGNIITYKSGAKAGQPKMFGKDTLRKMAIDCMKSGGCSRLITSDCLNESLNIESIDTVITTAGTTNPTTYGQRTARGKRVDCYNPEKETKIINLYIDDFELNGETIPSRDKAKLRLRQSDSTHRVIEVSSIDELMMFLDI